MPNSSYTPSSPSPLPPQASAATRRRRRRRRKLLPSLSTTPISTSASSFSSSPSSSASPGLSFSFPPFSPASSPFHRRFLSLLHASAVPFSWEHRPGIPKTPASQSRANKPAAAKAAPLPLPPSLVSKFKVGADDDTFSAADYFICLENARARRCRRSRQPALAATLTDWLAVPSLYRSCMLPSDCIAGMPATVPPRRPRAPAKAS